MGRLIESEIIPRLMLAQQGRSSGMVDDVGRTVNAADASVLARHAIGSDPQALDDQIRLMLARGGSQGPVVVESLAAAARLLSNMHREGLCTSSDLTMGLRCLQAALCCIGADLERLSPS
ncbi:hypothetical protein [uncultured Enterovirga sp.]|uniref:hypothetical protein n=1 Tax=uncultured Enterovirga sp. TaxID=2026352 RepID=UPI0035CB2546